MDTSLALNADFEPLNPELCRKEVLHFKAREYWFRGDTVNNRLWGYIRHFYFTHAHYYKIHRDKVAGSPTGNNSSTLLRHRYVQTHTLHNL